MITSSIMEKKVDYQKEMENIINGLDAKTEKPKLLLHACCAPCSSYVIECLARHFQITIYYYNPNIHPQEEYERRLHELEKFLPSFPLACEEKVVLHVEKYEPKDFFDYTNVLNETELQAEQEKGERCRRCYQLRMEKAFEYACANGFDFFTTTLSISPYKDSIKINGIGLNLNSNRSTKYLPADFKKKGGFLRSTQISKEYGLWRQDYCGCIYSKQNSSLPMKKNSEN